MIKMYVISENSRKRKIEDIREYLLRLKQNWFLKLVLGHQLCPDA